MGRDRNLRDRDGEVIPWPVSRIRSLRLTHEWALLSQDMRARLLLVSCGTALTLAIVGCLFLTRQTQVTAGWEQPPGSSHVASTETIGCGTPLTNATPVLHDGATYLGRECPEVRKPYIVRGLLLLGAAALVALCTLLAAWRTARRFTRSRFGRTRSTTRYGEIDG